MVMKKKNGDECSGSCLDTEGVHEDCVDKKLTESYEFGKVSMQKLFPAKIMEYAFERFKSRDDKTAQAIREIATQLEIEAKRAQASFDDKYPKEDIRK